LSENTPTQHPWRFLNTQEGNAFFNMATDEALVQSVANGGPPIFRIYAWSPPAVSFGYAQHIDREIDLQKCRDQNIHIVRRATGGRAVLHWNELTYSVICHKDDPTVGGSIQDAYRKISLALMTGVKHLGANVSFESHRHKQPSPRGKELTAPCFTSTAQHEVTLNNRKLIGSAQQRIGQTLLQHGSLLLGPEHKQIVTLFPNGKEKLRDRFTQELNTHTISLSEALNHPIDFTTTAQALRKSWAESFPHITLTDTDLSPEELTETNRLTSEKYATDTWNFKR
jgi:lipoate-protein ligase A